MARRSWVLILPAVCIFLGGCQNHQHKKPDATKGTVTGIVLCADTGKPARFATVILSVAPRDGEKVEEGNPLPDTESTMTDLDGRFRMEAVEPGRYYAIATQDGYLDPWRGLDLTRLKNMASERERRLDALSQWKDHMVEFRVGAHRTADLSIEMERAAEIGGTVAFDDGSPAIGMHFQLFRKTEKSGLSEVGLNLFGGWSMPEESDGHGHFNLPNLAAGEYTVCAMLPIESQDVAPRVCLGNTPRQKNAGTLKVQAGEIIRGADIIIPLSGSHTVSGTVTAFTDGHPLGHATVRMLYADDREKARETSLLDDGSFSFEYVPEGSYILQVSGAKDAEPKDAAAAPGGTDAKPASVDPTPRYADKEIPIQVLGDIEDMPVSLATIPQENPQTKSQSQ
jgi:hypothetical protein